MTMKELKAEDYWKRVEAACSARKMTQITLCEKTGIKLQTVRTAVSKSYMPKFDTAILIADALEFPLEYFATGQLPVMRPVSDVLDDVRKKLDELESFQDNPIDSAIKRKA